ncbi:MULTISPECIES: FHIPEP family type III secretion protein [unclassified Fusibacter]|uniref:FHIPEP family type III secretion protein n=1 Tax=unclassified Fusibacter TaxID=2624464 RepID=UPI00210FA09B|nr:FHIPEP family type III secretion protein [Fusibacter sp. A1]
MNLKAFLSQQLFFRSSDERWTNMIENDSHITIDIGKDLIPIALDDAKCSLFSSIKELRETLLKDYGIDLKKIRVKDNLNDLSPNEFQILNDDKVLIRKQINSENQQLQVDQIITQLKAIVL